jgi:hypothetical protein
MNNNPADTVQAQVAAAIQADEWLALHGVEAIAENRLDVEAAIERALGEVGICATVLTPSLDYAGDSATGAPMLEMPELVVSVAETAANRERAGACTALDAALRIALLLHSDTMALKSIRQTFEETRSLTVVSITFAATITLAFDADAE